MKTLKIATAMLVVCGLFAQATTIRADDTPPAKLKPYILKTCIVSDEKLDGDMGKPFVYEYKGREIKFCCKDCLKDFNKNPDKFIKKLEKAEAKAAKSEKPAS
jgi:YHS domain-containing protein